MKKTLLFLAGILFTAFYLNGQSFTLSYEGEVLGDTIIVLPADETAAEIVFDPVVNNNTNNGANVKVLRNEIFMLEGTSSYYKWGVSSPYNDTTNLSPHYRFVPAGGSSPPGQFTGYYQIKGAVGVSLIEYTFFNKDNPDENVKIVVKFDSSPTAIDENIFKNIWISEIYPNPATNSVNIDYDLPVEVDEANVKIVNILGSVVKERQIDSRNSNLKIDISDLNGGIYFYSLFVVGEVYRTKKLIVR